MKKVVIIGLAIVSTVVGIWILYSMRDVVYTSPKVEANNRKLPEIANVEMPALMIEGNSFLKTYASIKRAADMGNPDMALAAIDLIEKCQYLPAVRSSRHIASAVSAKNASAISDQDIDNEEKLARDQENFCADFPSDALADKVRYVTMAARKGNLDAKVRFTGIVFEDIEKRNAIISESERVSTLKSEALRHLQDAASAGRKDAVAMLANAYLDGTLVTQDRIMGLAYLKTIENTTGRHVNQQIREISSKLSPAEVVKANELALKLGN